MGLFSGMTYLLRLETFTRSTTVVRGLAFAWRMVMNFPLIALRATRRVFLAMAYSEREWLPMAPERRCQGQQCKSRTQTEAPSI